MLNSLNLSGRHSTHFSEHDKGAWHAGRAHGWTRPPAAATEQTLHQQAGTRVSLAASSSPLVILEEALQLIVHIDLQAREPHMSWSCL